VNEIVRVIHEHPRDVQRRAVDPLLDPMEGGEYGDAPFPQRLGAREPLERGELPGVEVSADDVLGGQINEVSRASTACMARAAGGR